MVGLRCLYCSDTGRPDYENMGKDFLLYGGRLTHNFLVAS